jgi:GNAT superfamily N-acetyltransferase
MIIKKATPEDREHIYKIWNICFTDDEAYINNYLDNCFPETTTWLLGENRDEFCSVLSIIPSFFIEKGERINGGYLYGVGTLPTHRGKSYSKFLMNHAVEAAKTEGLSYILVKPAEESLFQLYKKSGFDKEICSCFAVLNQKGNQKPLPEHTLERITFEDFRVFRETNMADLLYLWPEKVLKYAWDEIMLREGIAMKRSGKESYFIGYPSIFDGKESFSILESNINSASNSEDLAIIQNLLFSKTNTITIETPLLFSASAEQIGNGMQMKRLSALFMELEKGTWDKANNRLLSLPME